MAASDPVEETIPVFTEADVYGIGGYLAYLWRDDEDVEEQCAQIGEAIREVLSDGR